jgi:uncharacterized protein involved in exopolysaccharide biosynthesis
MDYEMELRRYFLAIGRHWRLIVALTLVGGLAAAAVSLALPNIYEAVALVSVSSARNTLPLNSVNQNTSLPVRAYPELAMSGDVVAAAFAKAAPLLPASENTRAKFDKLLNAMAGSDPTLVRLQVRDHDPQRAAQIVNLWADVFTAQAGQFYGQDQANLVLYQQQLVDAKSKLDQADSALASFESGNQVNILSAQLNSQQASLTDYLNREHPLQLLSQDAQDLLDRLNGLQATDPANLANDLALESVDSRLYGAQLVPSNQPVSGTVSEFASAVPIQLQIGAGQPMAGPTVADQKALAQNLRDTIAARLTDIGSQVTALEPQILALQGQVAEAQVKDAQLTRARDLAQGQYTQLDTQVQQANIATQGSSSSIKIASRAAVPTETVSPRRTLNTLLGAALGLLLAAVLALVMESLRPASLPAAQAMGDAAGVRA